MYKEITSIQNSSIKEVLSLQEKSRERRKSGRFVIEGIREISLAVKGNYTIQKILFCPDILHDRTFLSGFEKSVEIIHIHKEVYQKIAHRGSTEGIVAITQSKNLALTDIQFKKENPLVLVAEAPEKPGNIGALLRTADAANVDAVLIANPKTDMFNPNIIRSSVGCLFTTQIATGSTSEIITFLKEKNIAMYCAALTASKNYHSIDFLKSCAIVVGTEATGLSDEWLQNSTQNIIIPMQGQIDSLNVSVSAAILIFEAKRQRNFN
ncbi:MAG: RNA methyltransferase [Flavobacteriaceae bacterium]|nr:RNA methyltransferase [Flavobacteriaceae bacterium]